MTRTPTTQARMDLGDAITLALAEAEVYMRAVEAHHKAIGGDVLNPNSHDQRASLGECLLSHRVVTMLRQLAEMVPATVTPPECGACGDVDRANCAVCG